MTNKEVSVLILLVVHQKKKGLPILPSHNVVRRKVKASMLKVCIV